MSLEEVAFQAPREVINIVQRTDFRGETTLELGLAAARTGLQIRQGTTGIQFSRRPFKRR